MRCRRRKSTGPDLARSECATSAQGHAATRNNHASTRAARVRSRRRLATQSAAAKQVAYEREWAVRARSARVGRPRSRATTPRDWLQNRSHNSRPRRLDIAA